MRAGSSGLVLVEVVVGLLGVVIGGGLAGGLLAYSGGRPVNVLPLLGLFAVLPLVLSLLFVLGSVTYRWWRLLPVVGDLALAISLGRMRVAELVSRWWLRGGTVGLDAGSWPSVMGWLAARWSLGFGLWFQIGGMGVLVLSVLFSDLAFGWATTLEMESAWLAEVLRVTATPWVWAWSDATVDTTLIEASRIYRVPGDPTGVEAGGTSLGRWWPYLLMAMVVYGLLPRLLVFGWSVFRLRVAEVRAVLRLEGVRDVLLDLKEGPTTKNRSGGRAAGGAGAPAAGGDARVDRRPVAVVAVSGIDVPEGVGVEASEMIPLERAAEALAGRAGEVGDVQVLVRGWEPPVGDVLDDVAMLRSSLGEGLRVVVVLVASAGGGIDKLNMADWRRSVSGLGLRGVVVAQLDGRGGGDG
ncbi:hypothetical protein Pan265_10310 [Mucisphaera calidilacus]|uniref:DUF2868 domain-containing protein n=1 Tax=Mucisphaera calidilacus TaxID=2527982 RepID=A0A518BW25_9BACT|nr:hypothetical protein Pan265_10310 [Mucisphaera calidilacus]